MVIKGAELSAGNPVVILLHGRRQTTDDMTKLINKLNLAEATYYLPSAPGATWYPRGFTRALDDNKPQLNQGLEVIDHVLQNLLSQGVSRERIWIMGFSQRVHGGRVHQAISTADGGRHFIHWWTVWSSVPDSIGSKARV